MIPLVDLLLKFFTSHNSLVKLWNKKEDQNCVTIQFINFTLLRYWRDDTLTKGTPSPTKRISNDIGVPDCVTDRKNTRVIVLPYLRTYVLKGGDNIPLLSLLRLTIIFRKNFIHSRSSDLEVYVHPTFTFMSKSESLLYQTPVFLYKVNLSLLEPLYVWHIYSRQTWFILRYCNRKFFFFSYLQNNI